MNIKNFHYADLEQVRKKLDLSKLNPLKTLVQIFSGLANDTDVEKICTIMREKNDKIKFIGTTTAGEICQGTSHSDSIVISIMEFEKSFVEIAYEINDDDFKSGQNITRSLAKKNTKAIIVFGGGSFELNGDSLVKGINSVNKNVVVSGGIGGDNLKFKGSFVFCNHKTIKYPQKGCVAASLNGDELRIYTDYVQSWREIGKEAIITKADKNRIYTIDGISVYDFYKKYLGKKIADELPSSALEFPLVKAGKDIKICRTFSYYFKEDGSCLAIGNLKPNDKVKISFTSTDHLINDIESKLLDLKNLDMECIFSYTCVSIKMSLRYGIDLGLNHLKNSMPNSGFFSYGEIFSNQEDNKNFFFNAAMNILGISERSINQNIATTDYGYTSFEKKQYQYLENPVNEKNFLLFNALTHLINVTIEELEKTKNELKDLAIRDSLTDLYNRRYFNEISRELVALNKRKQETLSIILLDVDKFKNINDTYGHPIGDKVLKSLAKVLTTNARKGDIVSRIGGEEFSILLPSTAASKAIKIAEKLRSLANQERVSINSKNSISFSISVGVTSLEHNKTELFSDAFKRADDALYKAKNSGRNKVVLL